MGRLIYTRKGESILVDEEDYPELSKYTWYIHKRGYPVTSFGYNYTTYSIKLHRLILANPLGPIDHINGDKLDNRKSNLRVCTQAENCRNNTKPRANKTSQFKGVSKYRDGRWVAQIQLDNHKLFLGYYKDEVAAALAYNDAALKHHKEFAFLNKIP